jgi:nifR3 family TIM-barrel protein
MSEVTDIAFRDLCSEYGAGMTCTEFTHSSSVIHGDDTKRIQRGENEDVAACQLFGNHIDEVVEAAQHVEDTFDLIDINCGCPAWKVIKSGAGSALLNNPDKIASLVERLDDAVSIPVTVKIRSGFDKDNVNAVEVSKKAERAGAAMVGVHGRTSKQGYSGEADWDIIRDVNDATTIPIIGNGDVFTPEDFKEKKEHSGVDYVMLARGAMGNPYLFQQITEHQEHGDYTTEKSLDAYFDWADRAATYDFNANRYKQHAMQFTKRMRGGSTIRKQLSDATTKDDILSVMRDANTGTVHFETQTS